MIKLLKEHDLFLSKLFIISLVLFFILICAFRPDLSKYYNPSKELRADDGQILSYSLSHDSKIRFKTNLDEVDPLYIKLLLLNEDKRFYYHIGVDPIAIIRAFFNNIISPKRQGGSSIAMQVARLLEPKDRNLKSKIKEAFASIYLTLFYGHDMVLNMYLTLAPMGYNLEGIRAGSLSYFKKEPKELSPYECASLIALSRSPNLANSKNYKKYSLYKKLVLENAIKHKLLAKDIITEDNNIKNTLHKIPNIALQLSQSYLYKGSLDIYNTTIDYNLQQNIHKLANSNMLNKDIYNLAIVVIENKTNEIKALLGALDNSYYNYAKASISPGSALKPFAYAMAFDQNILSAYTLISDKPLNIKAWQPKNYTEQFYNQVYAKDALINSLNIPAIKVFEKLGVNYFLSRINHDYKYIKTLNNQSNLSIILGGCSISLLDLSSMYTAFSNEGKFKRAKLFKNENYKYTYLFDKRAALITANILQELPRAQGYYNYKNIAYKTGTSANYKNNLAIGTNGEYTVGVLIINTTDNIYKSSALSLSSPILFEVFSYLRELKDNFAKDVGLNLKNTPDNLKYLEPQKAIGNKSFKITFPENNDIITPDENGYVNLIFDKKDDYSIIVNGEYTDLKDCIYAPNRGFYNIQVIDSKANIQELTIYVDPQE